MKKASLKNILASRYATPILVDTWTPENKVILERKLWIAAMKGQKEQGLNIPAGHIRNYEKVVEKVDLESIRKRELVTKQDVKAKIEEFNELAGHEDCHLGFTSRDLTDNVEQLQIRQSLVHIRDQSVVVLSRLGSRALEYTHINMCGRSHNVPGQTITLGHRFAMWAEEMLEAFDHLEYFIGEYPLRGVKGAMGTQQDMLDLLGSEEKVTAFEASLARHLGFKRVLQCTGQVYPRSLDFATLAILLQLGSGAGNFATTVRLMAGNELMHEGFGKGQSGSTAMPHKVNSRTCERICGFVDLLGGYVDMSSRLVGRQWNEGDVSCSVSRRVFLSDAFFALDGLLESAMTVLDGMQTFPIAIGAELSRYLPFLSTTRLLMAAVKKGMGRETAHKIIKTCATKSIEGLRRGGVKNMFLEELCSAEEFPLDRFEIKRIIESVDHGACRSQVDAITKRVVKVVQRFPDAAKYTPAPIL